MQLDLTDKETPALLNLLTETIKADRYPLSPLIRTLHGILYKFGPMAPAPPPRLGGQCPKSAILAGRHARSGVEGERFPYARRGNLNRLRSAPVANCPPTPGFASCRCCQSG